MFNIHREVHSILKGFIMSKLLIMFFTVIFFTFQAGCFDIAEDEHAPNNSGFNLDEELENLNSEEEPTIRKSINKLVDNIEGGDTSKAILPLSEILTDDNSDHDFATKSVAASALSSLTKNGDWAQAETILYPVKDQLFHARSEFVRASAAKALGSSGWPQFIESLELAMKTDKSVFVRSAAQDAISALLKESENFDEIQKLRTTGTDGPIPSTFQTLSLTSEPRTCVTKEEYEWNKSHIIALNSETMQISVCE